MKYYYGAWQNFYHLNWPIRFFFEWLMFLAILVAVIKLLEVIGRKTGLRKYIIIGTVWITKEIVYLVGHTKNWAVDADNRISSWGEKRIISQKRNMHPRLKVGLCIGSVILYILAIFVDLPFSKVFEDYYLQEFANIKSFFQQGEVFLSQGYESYPPLFVEEEVQETMADDEVEEEPEADDAGISLRLNEEGQAGANIREEPSMDGAVVEKVWEGLEIIYQGQWENDGERYWLEVYCPEKDAYGWISGRLIDSDQLQEIISVSN